MEEAIREKKNSLAAKLWGYTRFDPRFPYDIFDFRVSPQRDGPAEVLSGYGGHAMADCYSGNMAVIFASDSNMTRIGVPINLFFSMLLMNSWGSHSTEADSTEATTNTRSVGNRTARPVGNLSFDLSQFIQRIRSILAEFSLLTELFLVRVPGGPHM
jgi:hypothetical protein